MRKMTKRQPSTRCSHGAASPCGASHSPVHAFHADAAAWLQRLAVVALFMTATAQAQRVVDAPRTKEKDQAKKQETKQQEKIAQNSNVVINGATSFKEEQLRSQFELFYRKNGFEKVEVRYSIAGNRLQLDIDEGARLTVADVNFVGNDHLATDKLFEFVIGPTRERYGKTEKTLPFVKNDLEEGVDLVRRLYISEGYLNAIVQSPHYALRADGTQMDVMVAVVEGPQYSFGDVQFGGSTVYDAELLRKEMADLLQEPYTDRRLADMPRRLRAY
jgi:outer membrane protein assembly factor BamA